MGIQPGRIAIVMLSLGLAMAACGSDSTGSSGSPAAGDQAAGADQVAGAEGESGAEPDGSVAPESTGADPAATQTDAPAAATDAPTTVADLPPRSMTMSFTGDTLPHSPLWRGASENAGGAGYDFFPMFAPVASVISSADVAVCHLETPIVPVGEELSTDPLYGVPPEIVGAMAQAGYDRCSTASNHTLDRGIAGIDRTIEVLTENGMGQSGMASSELDTLPTPFDVNGIAVAHLSYTYGTNGLPIPADEPWRTNLIDPARIVRDAMSARDLGADVVVVSMHWGTEGVTAPNEEQLRVADEITASGAIDLVIGHHAHVLQPIEKVNDVWVAYGLGNILSNHPAAAQWPASSQDAAIVEFNVDIDRAGVVTVAAPRVVPTWVDKQNGWVIRDVLADLSAGGLSDSRREVLQASLDRTAAVLGEYIPG